MSKAIQPGFLSRKAAACLCWGVLLGIPVSIFGQTNTYKTNGTEYAVVGSLPGDQVLPDAALGANGGFVVWQDNATDASGWGISARRLDGTLSGTLGTFQVNSQGTNDQTHPRVALLNTGGAAFVWQGGKSGGEQIYARFLSSSNTWLTTNDVLVHSSLNTNVFSNYSYATNLVLTIVTNWNHAHTMITGYQTNTSRTVVTNVTTTTSISATGFQSGPAVAPLASGNVVVVWASFNPAASGGLLDVYGQILSPAGQKVGASFLINQFTPHNQRTPAVATLNNGGFVVVWESDEQRAVAGVSTNLLFPDQIASPSADLYARLYNSNGVAQSGEFLVNTDSNPCANPGVAAASDGGFTVVWQARDLLNQGNGLDIFARSFSSAGAGGTPVRVNSYLPGDQSTPRISAIATDYLVVWTSPGQDGSREGVYGQFLHQGGSLVGAEFRVNTTTTGSQMQPVVAADGINQFLAIWTDYTGSPYDTDLYAQRYMNVAALLPQMSAPFVYAPFVVSNGLYQPQLQVSWSVMTGISISNYEVYVDGATTPLAATTGNVWTMAAADGLAAGSTHTFQVDYVTTDGRHPVVSPSTSGTTWSGAYWGTPPMAVPFEWMAQYFGNNISAWPSLTADSDSDGMNNYQEFLAGTSPTDPASALRVQINNVTLVQQANLDLGQTLPGMYVVWNTQPGLTYQVQVTTNFTSWNNLGSPRFATGYVDSTYAGNGAAAYFRVLLLRQ